MVIFVRHSIKAKDGTTNPPLSPEGEVLALEAAEWIKAQGIEPSIVVTSKWDRCKQTGRILSRAFNDCNLIFLGGIPTALEPWNNLIRGQWKAHLQKDREGAETVILVGSHPTQQFLVREFGAPVIPRRNKAGVFLLEAAPIWGQKWECVGHWPGRAAGSD